jgi:hypothetical protein
MKNATASFSLASAIFQNQNQLKGFTIVVNKCQNTIFEGPKEMSW